EDVLNVVTSPSEVRRIPSEETARPVIEKLAIGGVAGPPTPGDRVSLEVDVDAAAAGFVEMLRVRDAGVLVGSRDGLATVLCGPDRDANHHEQCRGAYVDFEHPAPQNRTSLRVNTNQGECMRTVYRALIVLAIVCVPTLAAAQGSITGVVKDSSGAVLPGVSVEVSSPVLIEKVRTAVTDGTGQYRIIDLRPGPYAVTATLQGF